MMLFRWSQVAAILLVGCGGGGSQEPGPQKGIGPEGGRVDSPDGNASLVIPAGALGSRIDVTLATAPATGLDAASYTGSSYRVAPADVSFSIPVTLTIKTDSAKGPIGTGRRDLLIVRTAGTGAVVSTNPSPSVGTANATIGASGDFSVTWGASTPCTGPESRQFDFWVGHWRYDAPGAAIGDQTVTVEAGGCAVREQFLQGNYRASSISTRSAAGDWYQTFIDSDGGRIVLRGTLSNGAMTLYQTPTTRFVWRTTSSTVVAFIGEDSADNGQTWRQTFAATYTKVP